MAYREADGNGFYMGPKAAPRAASAPYEPPVDYYDSHPAMGATTTAASTGGGGGDTWCQRMKRIYAQQWKKVDPALPAQSAMLGLPKAAASLAGNLIGIGLVCSPYVFSRIGWSAILLFVIFAALATFSAALLESCCEILESRFEEYRRFHWYTQYPDIASRALGPTFGKVVTALRWLNVVGVQAVVIVLLAECIMDWIYGFLLDLIPPDLRGTVFCGSITGIGVLMAVCFGPLSRHLRYWCSICYLPFGLSLLSLLLAGIAESRRAPAVLDITGIAIKFGSAPDFPGLAPSLQSGGTSFFVALGVLAFIYGSVYGFTSIRRDMMRPKNLTKAAACGIAGNTVACILVGSLGYSTFHGFLNGNIVLSLAGAANGIRLASAFFVMVCTEQLYSSIYVIYDEHDRAQDYGQRVARRRVLINTPLSLLAAVLAVAVPDVGLLMALVGALALCPVVLVLPPVFYFKLCQESPPDHKMTLSRIMKIVLALAVAVGMLVTIGGTVASIIEIVDHSRQTQQMCFSTFSYDAPFMLAPPPSFLPLHIRAGLKAGR